MSALHVNDVVFYTVIGKLKYIGVGNTFTREDLVNMGVDTSNTTKLLNMLEGLGVAVRKDTKKAYKSWAGYRRLYEYEITGRVETDYVPVLSEDRRVYDPYEYFQSVGVGCEFCHTQMLASMHPNYRRVANNTNMNRFAAAGYLERVGETFGILSHRNHAVFRVLKTEYPINSPFNPRNIAKHKRIIERYGIRESDTDGSTEEEPAP